MFVIYPVFCYRFCSDWLDAGLFTKKGFFYFFVKEQLITFPDLGNYLNSRFFPDIIAVIVSIPVAIIVMSIVFLGEERFYEEYSKKSLEEVLKGDLK